MTLITYSLQQNIVEEFSQEPHPLTVRTWLNKPLKLPDVGTHFGFVYQGTAYLSRQVDPKPYGLGPGMYFCLPGEGTLSGEASSGLVVTHLAHQGMFSLGGPIEAQGRFAYIDGGTSSLLIPPIVLGDPCLNAMYFPPRVDQTLHTHPSDRIGLVIEGRAALETPHLSTEVEPGTLFHIPANQLHKFCTAQFSLVLVVFHPDSATGFTHKSHPMLQRTLVDGVSAAQLPQIQTQMSCDPFRRLGKP